MKLCADCARNRRVFCPHTLSAELAREMAPQLKQEMFGPTPPNIFVGHNFYPKVSWGQMVAVGDVLDSPKDWYGLGFDGIIRQRAMQVCARKSGGVLAKGKMLDDARDAVMSVMPVDVEVRFKSAPKFSVEYDEIHAPMGPSAQLERMRLADNPRIPKKVDELAQGEVKAVDAIGELEQSGFDNYYITKLLTAGILGKTAGKKLVPTKWGITATDDMLAKGLMERIREMPQLQEFHVYTNEYLHNHFEVLLLPGAWEYEQFESMVVTAKNSGAGASESGVGGAGIGAGASGAGFGVGAGDNAAGSYAWGEKYAAAKFDMSEEYEPNWGRSEYAQRQGGGYYAARLGVCEGLEKINRQARAVLFREIGEGYVIPCGVWEVRENVRHAFMNKPQKFASLQEALTSISGRLKIPIREYKKRSRVLQQSRLNEF